MYTFPAIHAELRDTGWVINPESVGRPCQGIYVYEDASSVLRASKVAAFFPGYEGEIKTEDTLALITMADEQFARLQSFGVKIVNFSRLITRDDVGTPFIVTQAEKVESASSYRHETKDMLFAGVIRYMHDAFENRTPLLRDVFKTGQYVYGHTLASTTDNDYLVDVDPVVVDPKNLNAEWSGLNFVSTDHAVDFFSDKAYYSVEHMICPVTNRSDDEVAALLVKMPNACEAMLDYLRRRLDLTRGFGRRTFEERIRAINQAQRH